MFLVLLLILLYIATYRSFDNPLYRVKVERQGSRVQTGHQGQLDHLGRKVLPGRWVSKGQKVVPASLASPVYLEDQVIRDQWDNRGSPDHQDLQGYRSVDNLTQVFTVCQGILLKSSVRYLSHTGIL